MYCKTDVAVPSNGCLDCEKDTYQAHADKSEKYYQCVHGKLATMTCPDGLIFNITAKKCEWSGATCREGSMLPIEGAPSKYQQCSQGKLVERTCPDDLHFDEVKKVCTHAQVTTSAPGDDGKCAEGSYETDPSDCGGYFQCVGGRKMARRCPSGLHFSVKTSSCDWPANVKCIVKN